MAERIKGIPQQYETSQALRNFEGAIAEALETKGTFTGCVDNNLLPEITGHILDTIFLGHGVKYTERTVDAYIQNAIIGIQINAQLSYPGTVGLHIDYELQNAGSTIIVQPDSYPGIKVVADSLLSTVDVSQVNLFKRAILKGAVSSIIHHELSNPSHIITATLERRLRAVYNYRHGIGETHFGIGEDEFYLSLTKKK